MYRALVHSPDGARAFAAPALYVRHESRLDPRLRELAILRVGYLTRTEYEYAHHIEIGLDAGLSKGDIRALALDSDRMAEHFTSLECAVLAAAGEIVDQPQLSDEIYASLSAELDDEQVVDLVIVISFYCAVVRLLGVLQIDLEEAYCHYLTEFPLPS